MRTRLTPNERETVINYNKADPTAYIFTYDKKLQRRLERLGFQPTEDNGYGGRSYELPKDMILLPRAPMKLSDEERARRAEQARAMAKMNNRKRKNLVAAH